MIVNQIATLDEVALALEWAAAEGWNPGLDDAAAFHAVDPDGFFVAKDGDSPVAAISVVNHSDDFAFLGLYLCLPSHRGRGIGYAIWNHALANAGNRVVGLDGVPDQQDNYRKSGFVLTGQTTRFVGSVQGAASAHVRAAQPEDIPTLSAMEARASAWNKPRYQSLWLTDTETRRTLVHTSGDTIDGFVTVRRCQAENKIGPLVAGNDQVSLDLLRGAADVFPGDLSVDVPGTALGLVQLCQNLGLKPGFETARMYRGTPRLSDAPFYAVSTLELG
ncbi:MAG: GNAT family N-acetyltransferase [Pseudomonadota bacterium]